VDVPDYEIVAAIGDLSRYEDQIAEGAAAASVAAVVTGKVQEIAGRTVGVVVTGANIDRARLVDCLNTERVR
jgi:threonine dehydratase